MKKDTIIKFLLVIILIVVVVFLVNYINRLNTNTTEEHSFYQYFGGQKVEYTGVLEIEKRSKDIVNLVFKDKQIQLDSTPIYYTDVKNKLLLPQDMAIVDGSMGQMNKIQRFSTVNKEDDGTVYVETPMIRESQDDAFLFDGNDLYIALDDMTVTIDNVQYDVPALSYVYVAYKQYVEIYNQQADSFQYIETKDENVTAATDNYSINMSVDTLKMGEKEQLLLKKIDSLNVLQ